MSFVVNMREYGIFGDPAELAWAPAAIGKGHLPLEML